MTRRQPTPVPTDAVKPTSPPAPPMAKSPADAYAERDTWRALGERRASEAAQLTARVRELEALRVSAEEFRAKLSAIVGCGSPDGTAELDQVRFALERAAAAETALAALTGTGVACSEGEAMTSQRNRSPVASSPDQQETVPILEACRRVGVSRRTIYNWIATGKVKMVRTAGGAPRIYAATLWKRDENEQG